MNTNDFIISIKDTLSIAAGIGPNWLYHSKSLEIDHDGRPYFSVRAVSNHFKVDVNYSLYSSISKAEKATIKLYPIPDVTDQMQKAIDLVKGKIIKISGGALVISDIIIKEPIKFDEVRGNHFNLAMLELNNKVIDYQL